MPALFAADLDEDLAVSGAIELAEINPLPGAKYQRAVFYQDLLGAADDRAFGVGVGVAFHMAIATLIGRDKFGQD